VGRYLPGQEREIAFKAFAVSRWQQAGQRKRLSDKALSTKYLINKKTAEQKKILRSMKKKTS
jgi:hypothetical protein